MTEREFARWCFRWWADLFPFVLDNERSPVDRSEHIPPEGWVS